MSNVAEQLMSLDEFLAWERDQPESTSTPAVSSR